MSQPANPFTSPDGKKATCMEMLQFILDGESTQDQREYFKLHMNQCMPCFKSYQLDMTIKELLKTRCCGGDAPSELIHKIKNQISQKTQ